MLTNGNHLSAQGFEALFGSCSQQEQEHLLAELAGLGILVDTSAAIPSSRKATSFCRSDFTSKQLWSMTNEQLCVLAQQGDESAKEILVRKTAGFVHLMARRVPQLLEMCIRDRSYTLLLTANLLFGKRTPTSSVRITGFG